MSTTKAASRHHLTVSIPDPDAGCDDAPSPAKRTRARGSSFLVQNSSASIVATLFRLVSLAAGILFLFFPPFPALAARRALASPPSPSSIAESASFAQLQLQPQAPQPPPPPPPPPAAAAPPGFACSAADTELQLGRLSPSEAACPGGEHWPLLHAAGLSCRPLTLVNVGANKGYKVAALLAVLRPELGVTGAALYQKLIAAAEVEDAAGLCGDMAEAVPPSLVPPLCGAGGAPRAWHALDVHAFEPLPGNAALLTDVLAPFVAAAAAWGGNATHALPVSLSVHAAAVVGDAGARRVGVGRCGAGNERCGVDEASTDSVPATTLDAWARARGSGGGGGGVVDVLSIDAEGMDPEVLVGADEMLRAQRVRVLEFECVAAGHLAPL